MSAGRVVPGTEYERLLADLSKRVERLEQGPQGQIVVKSGSRIGDVIFQSERASDGSGLNLYAKDAKTGARTLIVTIA